MKPLILDLGNGARLCDFFMSPDIRKVKVNLHDPGPGLSGKQGFSGYLISLLNTWI